MNDVLHWASLLAESLQLDVTSLEGEVATEDAAREDGRVVDVDSGGRDGGVIGRHDVNWWMKRRNGWMQAKNSSTRAGPWVTFNLYDS